MCCVGQYIACNYFTNISMAYVLKSSFHQCESSQHSTTTVVQQDHLGAVVDHSCILVNLDKSAEVDQWLSKSGSRIKNHLSTYTPCTSAVKRLVVKTMHPVFSGTIYPFYPRVWLAALYPLALTCARPVLPVAEVHILPIHG